MHERHWSTNNLVALSILGIWLLAWAGCSPSKTTPPSQRARTHESLNGVLWFQESVEYGSITQQTFHLAKLQLETALDDANWTAALEQSPGEELENLPPAVIVDLDETILNNALFQARLVVEGNGYIPRIWADWMGKSAASAVPGAKDFLEFVQGKGVAIFYVTNRNAAFETATRQNLSNLGYPLDPTQDVVLMAGEQGWSSDKAQRRQKVAEAYRILLLVGDDLNDFLSGAIANHPEARRILAEQYANYWGVRWIVLPNPFYGSWEASLYGRDFEMPHSEKLVKKYDYLSVFR